MVTVDAVLKAEFLARHVDAAIQHFQACLEAFERENWEEAIGKSGKFIEAVSKALWIRAGKVLPPARQFKVGAVIIGLRNLPHGTLDDNIRVTLPRACDFVYDIASNRGARHDPDEVDPNEMDATAAVSTSSWIIAELVRYAGKGAFSFSEIADLISGLIERRVPFIETVDDRTYFHVPNASAREVGLLLLWNAHPSRLSAEDLVNGIVRHRFNRKNAQLAVSRLRTVVDCDGTGAMRLLRPGLEEADEILAKKRRA